jgi:Domain of unknown function (DUF1707)
MPEPHLRAGDADRAAVATVLGQHMSAGRLTMDEYDERLARAYAAKTYGELDQLTADLPKGTRERRPSPAEAPRPAAAACNPGAWGAWGHDNRSPWRAWASTALIVITIWAATSLASWDLLYFWPVWVIGPWGAVLLAQTVGGGHRNGSRDRHGEEHRQLG